MSILNQIHVEPNGKFYNDDATILHIGNTQFFFNPKDMGKGVSAIRQGNCEIGCGRIDEGKVTTMRVGNLWYKDLLMMDIWTQALSKTDERDTVLPKWISTDEHPIVFGHRLTTFTFEVLNVRMILSKDARGFQYPGERIWVNYKPEEFPSVAIKLINFYNSFKSPYGEES